MIPKWSSNHWFVHTWKQRRTLKIKTNLPWSLFGEVDWLPSDAQPGCSEDSLNSKGPFTWFNSLATIQYSTQVPNDSYFTEPWCSSQKYSNLAWLFLWWYPLPVISGIYNVSAFSFLFRGKKLMIPFHTLTHSAFHYGWENKWNFWPTVCH